MNWPLTAVVATTTNGTSKSNLLFIACLASPPHSLSLCLSPHPRWHNYLFILALALVRGPVSPITWAWPHFSRPAHWIAPIMRWQPQVPYGQARSDPGCLSLSGNMCAHNWPLSSLMAHRFATRQSASSGFILILSLHPQLTTRPTREIGYFARKLNLR